MFCSIFSRLHACLSRSNRCLLALLLIFIGLSPALGQDHPAAFWVSPDGNETAQGTKDDPFHSLEAARDHIRPFLERQQSDIVVWVEDGTHRLSRPFHLRASDSPRGQYQVIYRAMPGTTPRIVGSVPVTDWTGPDANGIYQAQVGQYRSRQLYVGGKKQPRAATKAYPVGFLPKKQGIEYLVSDQNPESWRHPTRWRKPHQVEAVCLTQWKMMSVPVAKVTDDCLIMQKPGWRYTNLYSFKMAGARIWSFWQVTRFENAWEFIDEPGEWFLDDDDGILYYKPANGEMPADVELPVLETLIAGDQVRNIRFEGLSFNYATWREPSEPRGYVSDQSGFFVSGNVRSSNKIGHVRYTYLKPTPGNLTFQHAQNITFQDCSFAGLGGVALAFNLGSQNNKVLGCDFTDIASSAIRLSGVSLVDHSAEGEDRVTGNLIYRNTITDVCTEFVDAAGIFLGFCSDTTIKNNTIRNVPWSGIAVGWGWGLMDPGGFPGVNGAKENEWGSHGPSQNRNNRIENNLISQFTMNRWDSGAIYTTGAMGTSMDNGLLIQGNVAFGKRERGGGNTFYTDGGTRYVTVKGNASYDNPIGFADFGPAPPAWDPLPYSPLPHLANIVPYGSDCGGCRTYGHITYEDNYWMQADIPGEEAFVDDVAKWITGKQNYPYLPNGFFNVCAFTYQGRAFPVELTFENNHHINGKADVPASILNAAGADAPSDDGPEQ